MEKNILEVGHLLNCDLFYLGNNLANVKNIFPYLLLFLSFLIFFICQAKEKVKKVILFKYI